MKSFWKVFEKFSKSFQKAYFQHVFMRNLFSCSIRKDACAHFVLLWHRALTTGGEPWDVIWLLLRRCGATVAETLSAWCLRFFAILIAAFISLPISIPHDGHFITVVRRRYPFERQCLRQIGSSVQQLARWDVKFSFTKTIGRTRQVHDHVSQFGIWCRSMSLSTGTKLTIPPCKKYWTRNISQKLRAQFFDCTLLLWILFHFPPPLVSYSHYLNKLATCCHSCLNMTHIHDMIDAELTGQGKRLDRLFHMSPIEEWLDPHWLT